MATVTTVNHVEYEIGKKIGGGGVGKVFRATRKSDGKQFAFKVFKPDPNNSELLMKHRRIKNNVKELLAHPLTDEDGSPQASFVPPLDLVDNLKDGGFGYIMEFVDLSNFLSVMGLWKSGDTYPDAENICKIGKSIATFFRRVHFRGFCYKDINEGNIYINPKTGEVKIIDGDNVGPDNNETIFGTLGYIAPEVYTTGKPSAESDRFSMAVFLYRLLTGGYPLDGKRTERYMLDNELNVFDAAPTIYGTQALFAFDPKKQENSIRNVKSGFAENKIKIWRIQTERWDNLPKELQNLFIKTFSDGLAADRTGQRTIEKDWYDTFDNLQQTGIVKCKKCKKYGFTSSKTCMFCDTKLPDPVKKLLHPTKPTKPVRTSVVVTPPTNPVPKVTPASAHIRKVRFAMKRNIDPKFAYVTAEMKGSFPGNLLHPSLSSADLMKISYNPTRNVLGALNLSPYTWKVVENGVESLYPPQSRVVLREKMKITVLEGQLALKVLSFE